MMRMAVEAVDAAGATGQGRLCAHQVDVRAAPAWLSSGPGAPPDKRPGEPGDQTLLEREPKIAKPRMYRVILHNDDYTTMDFVVWVLNEVFAMSGERAVALMLAIHKTGRGVAGVYTRDIAETKAERVLELAEHNGMPLLCTTELDD